MAPLYVFGAFSTEMGFIFAFIVGLIAGFGLERGGMGSAVKLTHQFYLYDLSVFKVMFSAIITAMLGMFLLAAIGFLDLSALYISPSHIPPQIVGGLILGLGFIVGGYCPGTSIVSTATGRIDGMFYLGGVIFGIIIFGAIFPSIEGFYNSFDMGRVTIPEYFNVSYGLVVFIVVAIAVAGFFGAEWVERKIGYKKKEKK